MFCQHVTIHRQLTSISPDRRFHHQNCYEKSHSVLPKLFGRNSRGHWDWKKRPGVDFFFSWTLRGLTNYVIRHRSKYSNMTSSSEALPPLSLRRLAIGRANPILRCLLQRYTLYMVASAASNHWLRVKGPDKQLQNEDAQILSVDFLNGLYLSKYLLPTLKILDLAGDSQHLQ